MSLWPVDDRATRELMVQFYRRYLEGAGAAAAMRGAMRAMIDAKRWSPKQWASFVVYGLPGLGESRELDDAAEDETELHSLDFRNIIERIRDELELPADTKAPAVLERAEAELEIEAQPGASLLERAKRAACELGLLTETP